MFWRNGVHQALPSLLHLQNVIDQIAVANLLGKRQGCFQAIPLQHCAEPSLPQRNYSGMQIHSGPTRQAWAEVFINQELQGTGAQPRWRSSALRGRPGGLGMRA